MSEFPKIFALPDPLVTISTSSIQSLGGGAFMTTSLSTIAYPTANLAIFIPFRITHPITIQKMLVYNGSTVSGNIDLGIYSSDGTKIISSGSTIQSGINTVQAISITSTEIGPGQFYLAVAMDNTTGTIAAIAWANSGMAQCVGMAQMASAFPLPATATFASVTTTFLPTIGLSQRSVV